jgi:hypothetical protein
MEETSTAAIIEQAQRTIIDLREGKIDAAQAKKKLAELEKHNAELRRKIALMREIAIAKASEAKTE